MSLYDNIRSRRLELDMTQDELARRTGYSSRSSINKIELGQVDIPQSKVALFAAALDTSPAVLMGLSEGEAGFSAPRITGDYVTYPVIGELAAGYDHVAMEDWSGETIDIPRSYLRGHPYEDFFVLTVNGNSMYPLYIEGDKVLVLRQTTLTRSGEIGVVLYDGDLATLKKVEYVAGEDWMKLIAINPEYPPKLIQGPDLELCRILGVPRLLLRELEP